MNKERMKTLAEELVTDTPTYPDLGFNMACYAVWDGREDSPAREQLAETLKPGCGTTACIGGLAVMLFGKPGDRLGYDEASSLLDLTLEQADRLFLNYGRYVSGTTYLSRITREEAASAVKRLLAEDGSPKVAA